MAIQISGTTIINNSKMLEGVGGKGGIIAGSFSVPSSTNKRVRLSGTRGITLGAIALDPGDNSNTDGGYLYEAFWPIRTSSSTSHRMAATVIKTGSLGMAGPYLNPSIPSNANLFGFQITHYFSSTKTCYYYFLYSGDGVPTVSIS